jgi:uncharacterized protein (DUF1330 family)
MKVNHRLGLMLIASGALGAAAVTTLNAQVKPPVYVVIDISEMLDVAAFTKALAALPPNDVASVGGRDIIRTMKPVAIDGSAPPSRFVVLQFDNAAQATAWENLPSTKQINAIRLEATKSRSFMVEGLAN